MKTRHLTLLVLLVLAFTACASIRDSRLAHMLRRNTTGDHSKTAMAVPTEPLPTQTPYIETEANEPRIPDEVPYEDKAETNVVVHDGAFTRTYPAQSVDITAQIDRDYEARTGRKVTEVTQDAGGHVVVRTQQFVAPSGTLTGKLPYGSTMFRIWKDNYASKKFDSVCLAFLELNGDVVNCDRVQADKPYAFPMTSSGTLVLTAPATPADVVVAQSTPAASITDPNEVDRVRQEMAQVLAKRLSDANAAHEADLKAKLDAQEQVHQEKMAVVVADNHKKDATITQLSAAAKKGNRLFWGFILLILFLTAVAWALWERRKRHKDKKLFVLMDDPELREAANEYLLPVNFTNHFRNIDADSKREVIYVPIIGKGRDGGENVVRLKDGTEVNAAAADVIKNLKKNREARRLYGLTERDTGPLDDGLSRTLIERPTASSSKA